TSHTRRMMFFFSSRRRHTRSKRDWSSDVCSSDLELTEELKKSFYYECQGITAVAMNLFILAQERALFDEGNPNEIITPQVLKKTAKEDMQTIQPMMTAIRTNNIA